MTNQRIELGSHSLRHADAGRGEPVFLCLHGLADTREVWDDLAGPLTERGRLLRIDQRGHGGSSAPPGRAELIVLPGCGHWLQLDAPADVINAVDRWRSGVGS